MTVLESSSPFAPHWAHYPNSYVAKRAPYKLLDEIDGNIEKPAWKSAVWSELFGDIQGQDAPEDAVSPSRTRFKALYDDTHLYIAAILYPSDQFGTQAHFTHRNDPIYQKDSDFEVFVDVAGSNHNYKELEINALNTIWNLLLNKPYDDGGIEHSAREHSPSDDNYYEVYHQKTAVQVLQGSLNEPKGALWSVEVALAYTDLYAAVSEPRMPQTGDWWRINFSRVELEGQVNWTWQPQIVWDPAQKSFAGKIAMHLPDAWGYLVFSGDSEQVRDPLWPARFTAMHVYYAQHYYREKHGSFATCMDDLKEYIDQDIISPFAIDIKIDVKDESPTFLISVHGTPDNSAVVTVTDDRYLQVIQPGR